MHPQFNRNRLIIKPLRERTHDLSIDKQLPLDAVPDAIDPQSQQVIDILGQRLVAARERGAAILMLMGAHVMVC
jgi:hypothetical protein